MEIIVSQIFIDAHQQNQRTAEVNFAAEFLQLQAEFVVRNNIYFLNHTDTKDTFYVEAYV